MISVAVAVILKSDRSSTLAARLVVRLDILFWSILPARRPFVMDAFLTETTPLTTVKWSLLNDAIPLFEVVANSPAIVRVFAVSS